MCRRLFSYRKLADLLKEKRSAIEKNSAINQRLQLVEKENKDIKLSVQEQRKVLMEKKARLLDVESMSVYIMMTLNFMIFLITCSQAGYFQV